MLLTTHLADVAAGQSLIDIGVNQRPLANRSPVVPRKVFSFPHLVIPHYSPTSSCNFVQFLGIKLNILKNHGVVPGMVPTLPRYKAKRSGSGSAIPRACRMRGSCSAAGVIH